MKTDQETNEPLLLTERQAAKVLSISPRKMWQLAKDGEIPYVRHKGSKRYDPNDLKRFIEAQKVQQAC